MYTTSSSFDAEDDHDEPKALLYQSDLTLYKNENYSLI